MGVIIFGSTGMLGGYIFNRLKNAGHKIVCINREVYDIVSNDWSNLNSIIQPIANENDVIINCAGIIPQKYKNNDFKTYIRVNSLFPHKLNELCKQHGLKFIHITTDCVFDGLRGDYTKYDKHTANDIYGVSKSQGEPDDATIIRTSIIGEELTGKKSFIEWLKNNANGKIKGYSNHFWNGVTCLELANYILNAINTNDFWIGVRHVYSPNSVSKYELCNYVNEIYELNINIEEWNDTVFKNMTLNGDNCINKTIYYQIKDLYNFNLLD